MTRKHGLAATGVVAAVLLLIAPQVLDTFWVSNLVQILVFGLFALSVSFLLGHAGMLPLGHAAFFAAGAYGTAYLQVVMGQSIAVSVAGGIGLAVLLGTLFSFAVRTTDVYFLLVTLALGMVVWGLAHSWTSVTRGENGIGGVVLPEMSGVDFADLHSYYYVVLAIVAATAVGYYVLVRSPFGLTLRGIRESQARMRTLGYNVIAHKAAAFILSAFIAGVAGVLYIYWNNFVSPPTAGLLRSAEAKLAAIIGGPTTILGAWFGAGVIVLIRNYLSAVMARYLTVMGLVFMAVALFFPKGVVGWRRVPTIVSSGRRVPAAEGGEPRGEEEAEQVGVGEVRTGAGRENQRREGESSRG